MDLKNFDLAGLAQHFPGVELSVIAEELKDCQIVDYEQGDFLCRDGEYDHTCGVILSGRAEVRLPGIKKDSPKTVLLEKGELFGEIAVLSGNQRIADIVAIEYTSTLIIPGNKFLELLDKYPDAKKSIDSQYLKRALETHLHSVSLFSGLSDDVIHDLQKDIVLLSFKSGDVIFNKGDEADYFYLIRYGYVKVSQIDETGKEKIVSYLTVGHHFGEIALMHQGVKRMATVTAISRTEIIGIAKKQFLKFLDSHSEIKANMEKIIEMRLEENRLLQQDPLLSAILNTSVDHGVVQSKNVLIMDMTKCINCNSCIKACASLHEGETLLVKKGVWLNNYFLVPASCRHCTDPVCMLDCPTSSIVRDVSGEIYHKKSCIGCGNCARLCPYGNITIVKSRKSGGGTRKYALKCDMCRHYPGMGCVYNCPTGAAKRVNPSEFFNDMGSIL